MILSLCATAALPLRTFDISPLTETIRTRFPSSSVSILKSLHRKFLHSPVRRPVDADNNTILHRWNVTTEGQSFPNDYVDYKPVPEEEAEAFAATFYEPAVCTDPRTLKCGDAHAKGLLSKKNLEFLHGGNSKLRFEKLEAMIPFLK